MFNFDDASIPITIDEIKSKVTDYNIFKKYCLNFEEVDKSFLSEFYTDTKASCRVLCSTSGSLYYKDFGTGDYYTPFDYVKYKYSCANIHEVCNIIANDFGLKKIKLNMSPKLLVINDLEDERPKFVKKQTNIKIAKKSFNLIDANYWNSYGISLETLGKFNVFSCSHVFVEKDGNNWIVESTKTNPIYAYEFNGLYKIYRPLAPRKEDKWLTNAGSNILQGYLQLPKNGELLILTKSLKDVLVYFEFGYFAIALQAETNELSKELFDELSLRFKKIIINYDNDSQGIISSEKLSKQYNLDLFYIEEAKDLSDKVKNEGFKQVKQYINKILYE